MVQVGQIQLVGAPATSLPACSPVQSQGEVDPMQIEAIIEPQVCSNDSVQQSISSMDGVTESPATEDDDVQIIFCAPRRRKKRRRRLESGLSASPLSQVCRPPVVCLPSPKMHHVIPQEPPRRRSISVVQRLESCHIGEERSPSVRAGSLPSIPCVASNNFATIRYPWFAEPSYCGTPSSQFPSLTDSAAWWDQSLPTLQPRPLPSIPWRLLPIDNPDSKKRKHSDDLDEICARPSHFRQSVQVSPRTTPASAISPLLSPYHISSNQFGMYGSGQHLSASPTLPSAGWDTLNSIHENQYGSLFSRQSPVPMDLSSSDATTSANPPSHQSSVSNVLDHSSEIEAWHHNTGQMNATMPPNQSRIPSMRPHHLPGSGDQLLQRARLPTPRSNPHASPPPSGTIALNNINSPHASPPVAPPRPGVQATSLHAPTAPVPPRGNIQVAQSSDMLRKPSLYSIPPWPSPLGSTVPPVPITTIQSHTRSPISNVDCSGGRDSERIHSRANDVGSPPVPNTIMPQMLDSETRVQATGITPAKAATAPSPVSHERVRPNSATFQIPKARFGRKYSPNLIVDIAETCQELFPFAEVAERHEVPIQKVFDTFSAIIQLPLLRNADDRRRHGSLGKRRMKEYRDAKKAMEKAQEAERKAQMKTMRARLEDATMKGKEGKNQPLLKSAVLNNAREVHGAN